MSDRMAEAFMAELDADEVEAEANLDALEAVNFCQNIWPIARQGLELLRDNVFTGGGLGSLTIRWAIGTIIRIVNGRCGG